MHCFFFSLTANINDRSMRGHRDSEIAVLIRDTQMVPSYMDGQPYMAGQFSHSLRESLFREMTGTLVDDVDISVADPICSAFYDSVWRKRANENTNIYNEVFRCLPTDDVHSWDDLTQWKKTMNYALCFADPNAAREKLRHVKGLLVNFPINFMKHEYLGPVVGQREYLVPIKTFT